MERFLVSKKVIHGISRISVSEQCRRTFRPADSQCDTRTMYHESVSSIETEVVHTLSEISLCFCEQGIRSKGGLCIK